MPKINILHIAIVVLVVLLLLKKEPATITVTEKEIIVQDHRDTVFQEIEVIKWKTEKVYETIIQLDTIRDTTVLVETQKVVIHDLVDINKEQDTTINRLVAMDSLNQEVIQEKNTEIVKDKKRINKLKTALKVSLTALGVFVVKEIIRL